MFILSKALQSTSAWPRPDHLSSRTAFHIPLGYTPFSGQTRPCATPQTQRSSFLPPSLCSPSSPSHTQPPHSPAEILFTPKHSGLADSSRLQDERFAPSHFFSCSHSTSGLPCFIFSYLHPQGSPTLNKEHLDGGERIQRSASNSSLQIPGPPHTVLCTQEASEDDY